MKNFYLSIAIAAVTAFGASAQTVDLSKRHMIDLDNLGSIKTWEEVSKDFKSQATTVTANSTESLPASAAGVVKAPAKAAAPIAASDLPNMKWEGSYKGILQNNSGLHEGTATFEYVDTDDTGAPLEEPDLYFTLPDYTTMFYTWYQEGSLVIYTRVNYGTNSQGYKIVMAPINGSNGAMLDSGFLIAYDEATDSFTFPAGTGLALCALNPATDALAGYFWAANNISIAVSTGDFTINAEIEDECTPDNKFNFSVKPGADVASVKVLLNLSQLKPDTYAPYIATNGQTLEANNVYTFSPAANMTKSGFAFALFGSYDAEGNLKKTEYKSFIVVNEAEEGWRTVGTMSYEDQLFAQYYNNFAHEQPVVLQEKEDTPGLLRLVNPYSDHARIHNEACPHYMILNIQDKEWVEMPFSVSGLDFGDGVLCYGSCAALGYTKTSGQANKLSSGTLEGNVVTFPAATIFAHEQYYNTPTSWSYFNGNDPVTITLPEIFLEFTVLDNAAPVQGAIVSVGEGEAATTDEEGKAYLTVPFETGYFGTAKVAVQKDASAAVENVDVALNGSDNAYTYTVGSSSAIDSIANDATAAPVEYFNLQGIRVDQPVSGGLYIRRQGDKVAKILVK